MRPPGFLLLSVLCAAPAAAETQFSGVGLNEGLRLDSRIEAREETGTGAFRLGGAVMRSEPLKALPPPDTPTLRLAIPSIIHETGVSERKTPFGGLALTFGESWNGRDVFHLGTSLTRGATTAGVSVTYEGTDGDVTAGKLYLDYAVTERMSVGVSGMLTNEITVNESPVPMVGINAELTGRNGGFVQGGVSDAGQAEPIFGLAVGLRF
ncbi:hypothetical protein C8D95_102574 [Silicimonas algicola]|uniref:Uncharacterized protein n=2 Tax=Silicimonas algicola TaxID=1826607 RepID=A0A316GAJ1_9RHOB|nr:hypothetical protein C8D95_102574 [Silicimonas algicola]